jgi:hypothetical protein
MNVQDRTLKEATMTKKMTKKTDGKTTKTETKKTVQAARTKAPKQPKATKAAAKEAKPSEPRKDTKSAIVLGLLRRKKGATIAEIAKATKWQNHSIRGFISPSVGKKMGLKVESAKNEAGERAYRVVT